MCDDKFSLCYNPFLSESQKRVEMTFSHDKTNKSVT